MGWRVDTDIQQMLRDSARAWLAEAGGAGRVRAVRAIGTGFDAEIWAGMGEMGWTGVLLQERTGGTELGLGPALTLAEELGRAASPEPFIASAVIAGTVLSASVSERAASLAAALAAGQISVTLAWQEQRNTLGIPDFMTRLTGGRLTGSKVHVPGWHPGTALLVAAVGDDGPCVIRVEPDAPGVSVIARRLADSSFCADLVFQDVAVADDAVLLTGDTARAALELALARGTVALCAQLEGLSTRLWQMTAEYLRQRTQFGSALADFQVLRHRMVDLYAEIEMGAASWRVAAVAVEAGDMSGQALHSAKARCSQAAQDMGRWAIQYHGAFGYMEEADVGLFVHAGLCWSSWLGNPAAHRRGTLAAHRAGKSAVSDSLDTLSNAEFRERWRTWLHANYPEEWRVPIVHRLSGEDERRWHRMTLAGGWRAPAWPESFGGLGLGLDKQLIVNEEMEAHGCARVLDSGGVLLAPVLMKYGSDEQKARYLPAILAGYDLWCQGYSEPNAGSDLASLKTSAVRDGDTFIVNGQKIWTTLAVPADRIFVLVRTNRDVKKQAGISFLLVDMDTPGLTVRPMMNLAGEDELCEVFFENVRVPVANLVGEVDQGWTVAKALLGDERIANGAPSLSRQSFAMLEQLIEGLGLCHDLGVGDRQAQLLCDIHDLGALHGQVAAAAIRGEVDNAVLGLMKVLATELFQRVTEELLRVAGDHAALMEPSGVGGLSIDLRRLFMVARPSTIYAGANEVQRNVAANMLMGQVTR